MNPQRPFDLKKLDFDAIRLRHRKRLLLYSAPLCFVALVVSLKFIAIATFSSLAHANYHHSQFQAAANLLQPLHIANWFEPYKAPFNHGNALFKKSDFHGAEAMYRKALETVPAKHECNVRINLALSLERLGDQAVQDKQLDKAILHYDQVKAVIRDGQDSCGIDIKADQPTNPSESAPNNEDQDNQSGGQQDASPQDGSGEDNSQTAKKIQSRVSNKSDNAKRARNNDSQNSQSSSDDTSSTNTKSTEDKIRALEAKSNEAQRERAKSQQRQRSDADYEKSRNYRHNRKNW
ncbi:MAG: hypothetical protein Q4A37_01460 [Candidatus Saccharibacteria bacterium]|nr:hypothetical protein [Candidatus Saccharibacteria bacterium]